MSGRKYSRLFNESAVKFVNVGAYSVAEAAKSLKVDPRSIRSWIAKLPASRRKRQAAGNLKPVRLNKIPWMRESARRFGKWLIEQDKPYKEKDQTWNAKTLRSPGIYYWTLWWINYEGVFRELEGEPWFQEGVKAFGLLALDHDCDAQIVFLRADSGDLFAACSDGAVFTVEAFLDGESLSIRHDPDFADMFLGPVGTVGHVVNEYYQGVNLRR